LKIIYFYQYFSTPAGSWGTRVYEFAGEWVKAGHDVTVVSSIYSKSDLKASKLIENQVFDGIKVKVLNISIDNRQPFLKRIWSFTRYAVLSSWYALVLPADVVIASSGPITVGIPGLIAHYLRGKKLVFETRDLWPEALIQLGIIRNKWIIKIAYWFEATCYNASSLIVTLSPGMKKHIECHYQHQNVISVTNAANIPLFSEEKLFNGRGGITPKKYAIYTGNIGAVNNSYWLFEAAEILSEMGRADIVILLVGEGQQCSELENLAKLRGIKNFIRFGLIPKTELVGLVQHALVSLVSLKGTPVLDTSSPNKFFESLAAGVPVIQNTNGWMKDFLREHQVGFTLDPNNPLDLALKLVEMDSNTEYTAKVKLRAMELAKKEFDKDVLAQKMLSAIVKIVS
jgi:glycosyltransferase involved in cell wall biosynthesis